MTEIRLPGSCLVVLVGPSGSGKSTWAEANFAPEQIVSSDRLRAAVGASEGDQRASQDAFAVLADIVTRRLRRKLVTVVDAMGLDEAHRLESIARARAAGVPVFAVAFDTPAATIAERNRSKRWPLPKKALATQQRTWRKVRSSLGAEGFDAVFEPGPVRVVPRAMLDAPAFHRRQEEQPVSMTFGLQISSFTWEGGPAAMASTLTDVATRAEAAGFTSLWVMDHFRQIPQVGREWDDMLDSYTTLAYLAAVTDHASLGALVTGVGFRNPAHLGKMLASLDVLSAGRAVCGLGIGWFEKEATAYGWEFPPVSDRYALLEDTLELLPLLWGPGSPEYRGRVIHVPEAMCYPRPLQDRIPILIGGSGEKRTLRLVAEHADMCNLFGDAATVRHKVDVLHAHCAAAGRDPDDITVTHLSRALTATDAAGVASRVAERRGPSQTMAEVAEALGAGTTEDQIGRYRELAEAGVQHAIVGLSDPTDREVMAGFGEVIAAFASRRIA